MKCSAHLKCTFYKSNDENKCCYKCTYYWECTEANQCTFNVKDMINCKYKEENNNE